MKTQIANLRVWENRSTRSAWIASAYKIRKCFQACNDCETDWEKSESGHVHTVVYLKKDPEGVKEVTKHVCDNCLNEY